MQKLRKRRVVAQTPQNFRFKAREESSGAFGGDKLQAIRDRSVLGSRARRWALVSGCINAKGEPKHFTRLAGEVVFDSLPAKLAEKITFLFRRKRVAFAWGSRGA